MTPSSKSDPTSPPVSESRFGRITTITREQAGPTTNNDNPQGPEITEGLELSIRSGPQIEGFSLSDLADHYNTRPETVARCMNIRDGLEAALGTAVAMECPDDGTVLSLLENPELLDYSTLAVELKARLEEHEKIVVGVYISPPQLTRSQAPLDALLDLGYGRVIIDGKFCPEGRDVVEHVASGPKHGALVATDTLSVRSLRHTARLVDALDSALSLGFPVCAIYAGAGKSGEFAPIIFVGSGYLCEACGRQFSEHQGQKIASYGNLEVGQWLELASEIKESECPRSVSAARTGCLLLTEVGLGGLKLGQALRTLSAGERLKVAVAFSVFCDLTESVFRLEEPLCHLPAAEAAALINGPLRRLLEQGNAVTVKTASAEVLRACGNPGVPEIRSAKRPPKIAQRKTVPLIRTTWKSREFNFPIRRMSALVGPSGCGKTTLLKAICSESSIAADEARTDFGGVRNCEYLGLAGGRRGKAPVLRYAGIDALIAPILARQPAVRRAGFKEDDLALRKTASRCLCCDGKGLLTQLVPDAGARCCAACSGSGWTERLLDLPVGDGLSVREVVTGTLAKIPQRLRAEECLRKKLRLYELVGAGSVNLSMRVDRLSIRERSLLSFCRRIAGRSMKSALLCVDHLFYGFTAGELELILDSLRELVCENGGTIIAAIHEVSDAAAFDSVVICE